MEEQIIDDQEEVTDPVKVVPYIREVSRQG
jgi:hypothetical protein